MTTANIIEIFCFLDEFCKYFEPELKKRAISTSGKLHWNRPGRMSDSEIMTILVLFHTSRFRDLKSFYLGYICQHMRKEFPHVISYNRFVERQAKVGLHLLLFFRKRSVIETVNDELKNVCHIEHTRHRSIDNFASNLFAGLIAYNLLPKKPEMNIEIIDKTRLIA